MDSPSEIKKLRDTLISLEQGLGQDNCVREVENDVKILPEETLRGDAWHRSFENIIHRLTQIFEASEILSEGSNIADCLVYLRLSGALSEVAMTQKPAEEHRKSVLKFILSWIRFIRTANITNVKECTLLDKQSSFSVFLLELIPCFNKVANIFWIFKDLVVQNCDVDSFSEFAKVDSALQSLYGHLGRLHVCKKCSGARGKIYFLETISGPSFDQDASLYFDELEPSPYYSSSDNSDFKHESEYILT